MTRKGTKTTPTWYELPFDVPHCTSDKDVRLRELLYEKHLEILKYNELLLYPVTATIYFFGTEVKLNRDQFNFLKGVLTQKLNSNDDVNIKLICKTKEDDSKYSLPNDKKRILEDLADVKFAIKLAIKSAILKRRIGELKRSASKKKHKNRRIARFKKQIKMKYKILFSVPVSDDLLWLTSAQKITENSYTGQCRFFDFDILFNQLIGFNGKNYISKYKKSRKPPIRELKKFYKDMLRIFCNVI